MADAKQGADYGAATKEQHEKAGYRLPDSFYKESNPSDPTIKRGGQKSGSAPAENKSATPAVETKKEEKPAPAPSVAKTARKSTRGKRK